MKRFDSINVIPLIDVMLVLLAIVLTTASFIVKDNLNIELPETQSTQSYVPPVDEKPVKFHIDQNNVFYLNEEPQEMASIDGFLARLDKKQSIVIQVDKSADFGSFVKLIDALKAQQLNNLTILTKASS
ncbi:biopolymer transporter ExbD [Thiomicrorhabdus sp.]|uniref:biopolymer transporter ExbD n=1 Tax=Thiomicrorhabdus sp. TaxID=2039724 RepID=UPI00356214FB